MSRDFAGGAGDYLNVGDAAAIDIVGTALTIHAWIKADAVSGAARSIVGKDIGSAVTAVQYYLHLNGGRPGFNIGDAAGTDSVLAAAALSTGVGYVLGGRKNGTGAGALSVWQDGVLVGSTTSNRSIAGTAEPLRLGGRSSNDSKFDGLLAEIAIWDVALSDAEMVALARGADPWRVRRLNLKGYWPLFGVAYPEADLSGNRNNATLVGTVGVGPHHPPVRPLLVRL